MKIVEITSLITFMVSSPFLADLIPWGRRTNKENQS